MKFSPAYFIFLILVTFSSVTAEQSVPVDVLQAQFVLEAAPLWQTLQLQQDVALEMSSEAEQSGVLADLQKARMQLSLLYAMVYSSKSDEVSALREPLQNLIQSTYYKKGAEEKALSSFVSSLKDFEVASAAFLSSRSEQQKKIQDCARDCIATLRQLVSNASLSAEFSLVAQALREQGAFEKMHKAQEPSTFRTILKLIGVAGVLYVLWRWSQGGEQRPSSEEISAVMPTPATEHPYTSHVSGMSRSKYAAALSNRLGMGSVPARGARVSDAVTPAGTIVCYSDGTYDGQSFWRNPHFDVTKDGEATPFYGAAYRIWTEAMIREVDRRVMAVLTDPAACALWIEQWCQQMTTRGKSQLDVLYDEVWDAGTTWCSAAVVDTEHMPAGSASQRCRQLNGRFIAWGDDLFFNPFFMHLVHQASRDIVAQYDFDASLVAEYDPLPGRLRLGDPNRLDTDEMKLYANAHGALKEFNQLVIDPKRWSSVPIAPRPKSIFRYCHRRPGPAIRQQETVTAKTNCFVQRRVMAARLLKVFADATLLARERQLHQEAGGASAWGMPADHLADARVDASSWLREEYIARLRQVDKVPVGMDDQVLKNVFQAMLEHNPRLSGDA